jgi:ribonuclease P protein component
MGEQSFSRQARLLKPSDFQWVFERAVISKDRLFRIFARASGGSQSRLGMAVSRKVEPHANGRNRIKRVVRESFRLNHPEGVDSRVTDERSRYRDYVVLPSRSSALAPNVLLFESLSRHWREIDRKLAATGGKIAETE